MTPGNYYMHEDCLDVCIYILSDHKGKLQVRWVNLGYAGKPFVVHPYIDVIDIPDSKKWFEVTNLINKVRKQPGLP